MAAHKNRFRGIGGNDGKTLEVPLSSVVERVTSIREPRLRNDEVSRSSRLAGISFCSFRQRMLLPSPGRSSPKKTSNNTATVPLFYYELNTRPLVCDQTSDLDVLPRVRVRAFAPRPKLLAQLGRMWRSTRGGGGVFFFLRVLGAFGFTFA